MPAEPVQARPAEQAVTRADPTTERYTGLEKALAAVLVTVLLGFGGAMYAEITGLRAELRDSSKSLSKDLGESSKELHAELSKLKELFSRLDGKVEAKLEDLEDEVARKKHTRVP